jgi:flagellar hook-basal body complex protein FliE
MSMEINQVLQQMRSMQIAATGDIGTAPTRLEGAQDSLAFGSLLNNSLAAVTETQQKSAEMSLAYASGDENTDLAQVMVSMQKASLSFEAVTQVRNKLLSAYQEVMNMQV